MFSTLKRGFIKVCTFTSLQYKFNTIIPKLVMHQHLFFVLHLLGILVLNLYYKVVMLKHLFLYVGLIVLKILINTELYNFLAGSK